MHSSDEPLIFDSTDSEINPLNSWQIFCSPHVTLSAHLEENKSSVSTRVHSDDQGSI